MAHIKRHCHVKIIAADLMSILLQITGSGVELQNIVWFDVLTLHADIEYADLVKVKYIVAKNGGTFKIVRKEGLLWKLELLGKHSVLVFGLLLFFAAAIIIPNRVYFIRVIGNQDLSTHQILMNAEKAGITFGARASYIRSEEVKNRLLENIPQLQWLGVTTKGCVAVIQVEERSTKQIDITQKTVISSIVSVCDGVIVDQVVYDGNPLFRVGDSVKKGDVLVSGYTDCGIKIKTGQSKAEIFGLTQHQKLFCAPVPTAKRPHNHKKHTCYKLRIGKNMINFCNHSGIMDTCCVKMYLEDYWTLPGGFQLPVSLIKITYTDMDLQQTHSNNEVSQWLPQFARSYLTGQMVSGVILEEALSFDRSEIVDIMQGSYSCREMIGRVKYEGIIE